MPISQTERYIIVSQDEHYIVKVVGRQRYFSPVDSVNDAGMIKTYLHRKVAESNMEVGIIGNTVQYAITKPKAIKVRITLEKVEG